MLSESKIRRVVDRLLGEEHDYEWRSTKPLKDPSIVSNWNKYDLGPHDDAVEAYTIGDDDYLYVGGDYIDPGFAEYLAKHGVKLVKT